MHDAQADGGEFTDKQCPGTEQRRYRILVLHSRATARGRAALTSLQWYVYPGLHAAWLFGRIRADRRGLPLAWRFSAALTGTIAANSFYLTMQFYYVYGFVALGLALPVVFASEGAAVSRGAR
jgi:hypothetical protein